MKTEGPQSISVSCSSLFLIQIGNTFILQVWAYQ